MRFALLSCALIGCAYQPGSFSYTAQDFAGQRATVGCIDLAVQRRPDLPIGPVLAYQFANRCDHAATIDLAAVSVIGRAPEGDEVPLRPYDPRGELAPAALDGRNVGGEALAYSTAREIAQICVDAATLAHDGAPRWLCFGTPGQTVIGRAP